ncbi:NAD(+) synthase [Halanaerobium saccharolyticum]|jgi:NAD+ synthase|nr:NAD(+) synthase [Halanaerobium saccharolyticum]
MIKDLNYFLWEVIIRMIDENLANEIQEWMQEKVEARNADGVVVGLSGGIDSSVVGALAKEAFGDNVLGVMLPANGTVTKDVEYAELLADKFDIETLKVNMKEINEPLENRLKNIDIEETERNHWPQTKIPTPNPAEQNIQTRLRMMTLYYIAEKKNYVVMGTSNKSEILTGYYTLYGDGATDMRPIGDLNKTQVWELAEVLGVPEEIINRPPTGGCRGDESDRDEKEFGISYEDFDQIYESINNNDDLSKFEEGDVKRVKELIDAARDKSEIPTFKIAE